MLGATVSQHTRRVPKLLEQEMVGSTIDEKYQRSTSFGTRPDGIWARPPWTTHQRGWSSLGPFLAILGNVKTSKRPARVVC